MYLSSILFPCCFMPIEYIFTGLIIISTHPLPKHMHKTHPMYCTCIHFGILQSRPKVHLHNFCFQHRIILCLAPKCSAWQCGLFGAYQVKIRFCATHNPIHTFALWHTCIYMRGVYCPPHLYVLPGAFSAQTSVFFL